MGPAIFSPIFVEISLGFKIKEFAQSNSHVSRIQTSSKETAVASKVVHSVPSASVQSSFLSQFRLPQIPVTLSTKADVTVIRASPESKTSCVLSRFKIIGQIVKLVKTLPKCNPNQVSIELVEPDFSNLKLGLFWGLRTISLPALTRIEATPSG